MRQPSRLRFVGLLAVLLQILAPGWLFATVAQAAATDAAAAWCVAHDDGGTQAPGKSIPHHHTACPACQAGVGAHAALPVPDADIPAPRELVSPQPAPFVQASPRGPPGLTARARAPPPTV